MPDLVSRPTEAPLTGPALEALRHRGVGGLSRRTFLRRGLGAAVGVWLVEVLAGTLGFVWSAASAGAAKAKIGTFADFVAANPGLPFRDGFPVYVPAARAFIVLVDPGRGGWTSGLDAHGEGSGLNVRALSQVCPHLGCRPNPCLEDFWFHCPCHQSRYDRLGIKAAGELYGPAPRGMDRLALEVDEGGVLTVDPGRITLGPLPVALGQPGLIPPRVANGCV